MKSVCGLKFVQCISYSGWSETRRCFIYHQCSSTVFQNMWLEWSKKIWKDRNWMGHINIWCILMLIYWEKTWNAEAMLNANKEFGLEEDT